MNPIEPGRSVAGLNPLRLWSVFRGAKNERRLLSSPTKTLLAVAICLALVAPLQLSADSVGDIQAFYNSSSNFGLGVLDGTVFVFQNTSGAAITNGVFSVKGDGFVDSFKLGTIGAGATVFLEPGISNDGGSGHTFFLVTGSLRDESDSGPNGNDVQFDFTGLQGSVTITSGIFTPAATQGPSNDGTIADINFLGGGPQSDGACSDCFGPKIVATLAPPTRTPEPATMLLLGSGLAGLLGFRRHRKVHL